MRRLCPNRRCNPSPPHLQSAQGGVQLIRNCTAPLHVKLHAIRCVPSLFQYHVFATALSHPDVANVLATQVDLAVTDAIETLTAIPIAHSALLGIQTLLPTVLPCRVIIARGTMTTCHLVSVSS